MSVVNFPQRLDRRGYESVPNHTIEALERYVFQGYEPGGFLVSVLSNDLTGAVGRADSMNRRALAEIVDFVYNRLPAESWGDYGTI